MSSDTEFLYQEPLPIVEEERGFADSHNLFFNETNFRAVLKPVGDRDIAALSINGSPYCGKSTLFGYLVRYLTALEENDSDWIGIEEPDKPLTDFRWKSGKSPSHLGIWVHNRPFIINLGEEHNNKEVAVLLFYTQCPHTDDWNLDSNVFAILGLSILLSSFTLFNLHKTLSETVLSGVCNAVQFGVHFKQGPVSSFRNSFQNLLFVIRDWDFPCQYPYGVTGGTRFLNESKFKKKSFHSGQSCATRQILLNTFGKTTACLLPFPGNSAMHASFNGSINQLDPRFLFNIQDLFSHIVNLHHFPIKRKVNGSAFTYKEMENLIRNYVSAFNRQDIPEELSIQYTASMFEVPEKLVAADVKTALDSAVEEYMSVLNKFERKNRKNLSSGKNTTEIDISKRAKACAQKHFQQWLNKAQTEQLSEPFFLQEDILLFKDILDEKIKTICEDWQHKYIAKMSYGLKNAASQLLSEYYKSMEKHFAFMRKDMEKENSKEFSQNLISNLTEQFQKTLDTEYSLSDEFKNTERETFLRKLKAAEDIVLAENFNVSPNSSIESCTFKLQQAFLKGQNERQTNQGPDSLKFEVSRDESKLVRKQPKSSVKPKIISENVTKTRAWQPERFIAELVSKDETYLQQTSELDDSSLKAHHQGHLVELRTQIEAQTIANSDSRDLSKNLSLLEKEVSAVYKSILEKRRQLEIQNQNFKKKALESYKEKLESYLNGQVSASESDFAKHNAKFFSQTLDYLQKTLTKKEFENSKDDISIELNKTLDEIKSAHLLESPITPNELFDLKTKAKEKLSKIMKEKLQKVGIISEDATNLHEEAKLVVLTKLAGKSEFSKNPTKWKAISPALEEAMDTQLPNFITKFKEKQEQMIAAFKLLAQNAVHFYDDEMKKELGDGHVIEPEVLQQLHEHVSAVTIRKFKSYDGFNEIELESVLLKSFQKYKDENDINAQTELAIGIDLGTTFSCVSVYAKGKLTIIPNQLGQKTTPSYVYINTSNDEEIAGQEAKDRAFENPDATIFDAKRLIGRDFSDNVVQEDIKKWPFLVVNDKNDIPLIKINDKTFHPEEISAKVLAHLKEYAEQYLGQTISKAVITVPAYFGDGQKQATIDAGKMAGLEVLAIITEPVAAALAYKLQYLTPETYHRPRNILIFDLGGGTFDVAVVSTLEGKIDVIALGGDTHLGGEDFDNNLMTYCVEEFKRIEEIDLLKGRKSDDKTIRDDVSRRLRRLLAECERKKIDLTSSLVTEIVVDRIYKDKDLAIQLTRFKFEEINQKLFNKTLLIVQNTLKDANLKKEDVDDIVLVGGSTRIPKIQQMLSKLFNGIKLNQSINPDEAVAHGAGLQAATLQGRIALESTDFVSVQNITPMSIGTELSDGTFAIIIPKGTRIPTKLSDTYITTYTNQTEVTVLICEGEHRIAKKNKKLGEFVLTGIPPRQKGKEKIEVTLEITDQGILHATACSRGSGSTNSLTVTENKKRLSEETKSQIIKENLKKQARRQGTGWLSQKVTKGLDYVNELWHGRYDE